MPDRPTVPLISAAELERIKTDLRVEDTVDDPLALTVSEWKDVLGLSRWKATMLITQRVKDGAWEQVLVRRQDRLGRTITLPGYRKKKEKDHVGATDGAFDLAMDP